MSQKSNNKQPKPKKEAGNSSESERFYQTLFDSIDEGFCVIEMLFNKDNKPIDYRFLNINPAFEEQTGLQDAVGKRMRELAPQHEEHWFEIYGQIALSGEPERFIQQAEHLADRWYSVYAFRVGQPEEHKVAILFRDITKRKQVEQALRESEARYRELAESLEAQVEERTRKIHQLARELTMSEHEERGRIAQILHDDLQQQIYAVQLQLIILNKDLSDDVFAEKRNGVLELLKQATMTARQLSVDLSPPILEDEGLTQAIAWLAELMEARYHLRVKVEAEQSFKVVERDLRVLLFQIVRELLFNVVKHAQVQQAMVHLQLIDGPNENNLYRIDIVDKGIGFDPKTLDDKPAGWGLSHIRQRLNLIGGDLKIVVSEDEGTRMTIVAPTNEGE